MFRWFIHWEMWMWHDWQIFQRLVSLARRERGRERARLANINVKCKVHIRMEYFVSIRSIQLSVKCRQRRRRLMAKPIKKNRSNAFVAHRVNGISNVYVYATCNVSDDNNLSRPKILPTRQSRSRQPNNNYLPLHESMFSRFSSFGWISFFGEKVFLNAIWYAYDFNYFVASQIVGPPYALRRFRRHSFYNVLMVRFSL